MYAPEVVARAILRSAEHPQRNVLVGGGAKVFNTVERFAPRLADRFKEATAFEGQRTHRPVRERDTLFGPKPGDARVRGHYEGHVMRTSAYTRTRLHAARPCSGWPSRGRRSRSSSAPGCSEMATRARRLRAAATGSAADFVPPKPTLPRLRAAAARCRGCDLWVGATQTVFGEGPRSADVMLVGEQPGDQEDRQGHPFVGPSGQLLNEALSMAGIDRRRVYVTNAVKHFKFVRPELTRRRLHKKPTAGEVRACRPWLEEEIRAVKPRVIVALGATAAQALLGPGFRVTNGGVVRYPPTGPTR